MFMVAGMFASMAICLVFVYTLVLPHDKVSQKIQALVNKYILWIGLFLALSAMISSLVYSDIIGFPPCLLCWYTRVAFYPQVFLYGLALWRKERFILDYTLLLTAAGTLVSIYHYLSETFQYSPLPCAAGGVSCLTRYVYEFGFITIPFMGLIGFITLLLALIVAKRAKKNAN